VFQTENSEKYQTTIFEDLKKSFPKNAEISIAIIDRDTIHFVGFKCIKKQWANIDNNNSVFEIGSITKVFTSILLSHAVAEGMIKTSDPISESTKLKISKTEKNGKFITFESLANHTSGLPRLPPNLNRTLILDNVITAYIWPFFKRNGNPYYGYNQKKINRYLRSGLKPKTIPGEVFKYSNLGAGLVGHLLENKTGVSYEVLLQNKIFHPFSMTSTTTNRELIADKLVKGRSKSGEKVKNWDFDALKGAGAILSSANDLAKFASANFEDDPILAFPRKKTFTVSPQLDIGLGWFIYKPKGDSSFYWHNGGTGGYSSSMAINVESRQSVIILTNVGGKNKSVDNACVALMKAIKR